MAAAEVEETIRRLSSHKGVEGIVISTYEGVALKSTLSAELTAKYAGLMSQLVLKARGSVRTIDAEVRAAKKHMEAAARCVQPLRVSAPHHPSPPISSLFFSPQNDLVFLRARTRKHEVMIAPGEGYVLVVRAFCACEACACALLLHPHARTPQQNLKLFPQRRSFKKSPSRRKCQDTRRARRAAVLCFCRQARQAAALQASATRGGEPGVPVGAAQAPAPPRCQQEGATGK